MSKEAHTRVEFDTAFHGGDYDKVGRFALIPHSAIEAHGGSVERAFKASTGIEPCHMIHFAPDEVYDAAGKWVEVEPLVRAAGGHEHNTLPSPATVARANMARQS